MAMNPLSGIFVGQELVLLFTMQNNTQQVALGTVADISYANTIGDAPAFGQITSAEQDIMHFSGTISITRWAERNNTFRDMGICPVGSEANTTGYFTVSLRSNVDPTAQIATLLQCLPQDYSVNGRSNDYFTESLSIKFLDAK